MGHDFNYSHNYQYAAARSCAFRIMLLMSNAHRDQYYELRRDLDATRNELSEWTERIANAQRLLNEGEFLMLKNENKRLRRQLGLPSGGQPGGAGIT